MTRVASPRLEPGGSFGPYTIEAPLGEGAMGVVVRARRGPEGEAVALKVLRAELAADDVYRRRFAHELRAAGGAASRHLVKILDAGEVHDRPYIAMPYVPGPSLEERIEGTGP